MSNRNPRAFQAVIGWFWLTPDGTHPCQVLLTACSPIGKGDAKCTKLWFQVAHPDAKEEPSFGEFVETQEALGIAVIGQFRDLNRPDRFVWLRGFETIEARGQELAAFMMGRSGTRIERPRTLR